jgi:hypothetical protein
MLALQTVSGTRAFVGKASKQSAAGRSSVRVCAKAGNWLPGSDTPAYLESLPASYGFGKLNPPDEGVQSPIVIPDCHRVPSPIWTRR